MSDQDLLRGLERATWRVGATSNLLNLLQKQHPADLAQIYSELPEKERHGVFNVLVEKNGRLAMEALSELGPEEAAANIVSAIRRGRRVAFFPPRVCWPARLANWLPPAAYDWLMTRLAASMNLPY